MSDSAIAEYVGVHHSTVAKFRASLESTCEISKIETRAVTRGDQEYEVNVSNIGRRASDVAVNCQLSTVGSPARARAGLGQVEPMGSTWQPYAG